MEGSYPVRKAHSADLAASQNTGKHPIAEADNDDSSLAGTSVMSPVTSEVKHRYHNPGRFGTGKGDEGFVSFDGLATTPPEEATPSVLQDAVKKVSEFDLVAYSKSDMSKSVEKRVMARMFAAFDVTQQGYLDVDKLKELCQYVGRAASEESIKEMFDELHAKGGHITFDAFWSWWRSRPPTGVTKKAFSLVSADFSVPYHQQQLEIVQEGEIFTPSFRIRYFFKDLETNYRRQVSPWHDIPLYVRDPVRTKPEHTPANRWNFICEIPKWTRAKFEIATGEAYNPIKQDIKNGLPRFYKHGDMMWNYGAMPQTWESTEVIFEDGVSGDNDPIDAVEIGMRQMRIGETHPVRVLGVLGMIDEGQMDWKVIVISVNDPITRFLKDITDVPKYLPGCLDALREWFRVYKICQGGVENKFAFDGEFKDKKYAMKIVEESHYMWENLRKIKRKEKV